MTILTRLTFFLVSLTLVICGCKTDPKSTANELHIRIKKDPERINPLISPNPTSREIYQYIHLSLADYDPNTYELMPILIKSIPTEIAIDSGKYKGGICFDIEIREEAKWDDGSPITAEDYLFTVKAINHPATNTGKYRELTENIKDVIIDPSNKRKFRVIFGQDYLLALETAINIEVYQKSFYDTRKSTDKYALADIIDTLKTQGDTVLAAFVADFNGNDYSRTKIQGAGPYKFVSWQTDQTIVLEKKENYWGANIKIPVLQQGPQKMIFHVVPDEVTAFAQLQNGSVDMMTEVSPDKFASLQKDTKLSDRFSFYNPVLTKYYMININNGDPKLSDKRVRKALNHLLNIDDIVKNLENGQATRLVGPIHPIKKTYNDALKLITYDVDAAKALLAEAGWSDSNKNGIVDKKIDGKVTEMVLDIYISGQELGKRVALMMKENAAKVGITINVVEKDFKAIKAENLKTRQYHLVPSVVSQDMQPWDDLSGRWHSSSDTPSGSNENSYRNPVVDQLIDKVLISKNETERIAIYREIQKLIYDDYPAIFLYAPQERIVINKKWNATSTAKRPGYLANTFTSAGAAVGQSK